MITSECALKHATSPWLRVITRKRPWLRLNDAPRGHAALTLNVRRLDRIGQASTKSTGEQHEHRLVYHEAIGPVGQVRASPGRTDHVFEPDVRRETSKEQPAAGQHTPHLLHHRGEVRLVVREMKHGATYDSVHA